MKTDYIKERVAEWKETDEVFFAYYDKAEADEFMEYNHEEEKPLTEQEWVEIVRYMDTDEGIWEEITQAFNFAIERVLETRKGNNGNNQ